MFMFSVFFSQHEKGYFAVFIEQLYSSDKKPKQCHHLE